MLHLPSIKAFERSVILGIGLRIKEVAEGNLGKA
jgi:hypothetical protein